MMRTRVAPVLDWLHERPLATFAGAALAEACATALLTATDIDLMGVPGALAVLISVVAALASGPFVGSDVGLIAWAIFLQFVADRDTTGVLALPFWLATPFLAGWIAREMRRSEEERSRLVSERELERVKTDFVATASHELRTPLAAIYGAALTLERSNPRLAEDDRAALMHIIGSESTRLVRIVNEILLADVLERGGVAISWDDVDALEVARAAVSEQRLRLAHELPIRISAPGTLPRVRADREKLLEVLGNLIDNAIKYSHGRGEIELSLASAGDRVRFAVSDPGIGIAEADRERIFDRFVRVDPHMTQGVGGTGLGLYICRELVSRMGGRIWVDSREGEGSVFWFELQAVPARAGAAGPEDSAYESVV